MSLSLYSEDGDWLGPLASGGGWHDVCEAVGDNASELGRFCDRGYSVDPAKLKAAVETFVKYQQDLSPDVASTLENLGRLLAGVTVMVIASDSLVVEDTADDTTATQ